MKKKRIFISVLFTFVFYLLSSQTPQGFNYQAIARDGSGTPIINASLQVKLAIMADSLGNTVYWEELFNPVPTNAFGLFTVILGRGSRLATSAVAAFTNINWKVNPIFLRTQIFYQNAWKNMGSTRLWSVPYALQSNNALSANSIGVPLPKLSVSGTSTAPDSILFEVKNSTGQTIFAVYNEGVRIYVDDGVAKGATKGGFAIGGFGTAKGTSQEYFRVTRDSTRVYVNQLAKTTKGGFAIGGFSPAKGADTTQFLNLTPQNYFIGYGAGNLSNPGLYNSFMGYHTGTNNTGSYNSFIGYEAGNINSTGTQNVFLGYQTGLSNTTGFNNSFLGAQAGQHNQTGYYNTFLGNMTGSANTSGYANTFVGTQAGLALTAGSYNTYIGSGAGYFFKNGNNNIFIGSGAGAGYNSKVTGAGGDDNVILGTDAGFQLTTGNNNIMIGNQAGLINSTGNWNVYIGNNSGYSNSTGVQNVFLGAGSGYNVSSGTGNIFIGYNAASNETNTSNKLFIENSGGDYTASLIYGDFSTGYLRLNAAVDIRNTLNFLNTGAVLFATGKEALWFNGTYYSWGFGGNYNYFAKPVTIGSTSSPAYMLYVNGNAWSTGSWGGSDIRWKKDLQPLDNLIPEILQLGGYRFNWRKEEFPEMNFDGTTQIGLVAQEVEKVFPELVKTDTHGYKAVSYEKLSVILLEGIKEQEKKIDSIIKQNDELRSDLQLLKDEVQVLKTQAGLNNR